MKSARLAVIFALVLGPQALLFAQTAPTVENGFKSFGSYHGGSLDTVNLQNGNLMFHVPFFSYPQRGGKLDMSYVLTGSSKNWQVGEWTDSQHTVHYKWILSQPAGVVISSDPASLEIHRNRHLTTDLSGNSTYTVDNYAIATMDGSWHWLSGFTPSNNMVTMDGSTIQVVLTHGTQPDFSDDTATVIFPNGTHYFFPNISVPMPLSGQGNNLTGKYFQPDLILDAWGTTQTAFDAATVINATDPNGNLTALPIDSLGHDLSAPNTATSDYSGCVTSRPITNANIISFPGPDGHTSTLKICVTNFVPTAAFSQPNVDPPSIPSSAPWQLNSFVNGYGSYIGSIVMPDGNHWSFDYDDFGNVAKITLPTGGTISYQWTEIPDTCADGSLTRVSRAVSYRTVNDNNGHSYQWQYTWGALQNGSITNYVLDPNGNETAHVFTPPVASQLCYFYETETRSYQGTHTNGTLLKTVDTHYKADVGFNATSSFTADVVPDIITTTLPGGKVSQVVRQYDLGGANVATYGNVTNEKIYDYGSSPHGALLRETVTTYQWQVNSAYLDAGFLNLPASVVIKDGSGCNMAETDYTYDEPSYLTTYPGTLPAGTHGAAPGGTIRGNLTTVTKWAAPTAACNPKSGTAIVSHTKWYDTGVPCQSIDPLGHTTTITYDSSYAGAYATQTCSPQTGSVAHCISGTYDSVTGLLESLTNENATALASGNTPGDSAHTSSYTYDTSWRLIQAQAPPDPANSSARATTTFTPSAPNVFPLSVQHQRSVTTALTDTSTAYFDGADRINKTTHSLPNGTATVITTYDGVGQATSVTNPYFTTSDPTYGVTYPLYDGIGRVTQITKQDSSVSSVKYNVPTSIAMNADCTITKDEAGNQRGACTNALGRLVEVDEPNPGTTPTVSNYATMQTDGNFVLYNPTNTALWSSGTNGTSAGSVMMQDDGNLVLYIFKWSAGSYAAPSPGPFAPQSCSIGTYLIPGGRINANQCIVSPHGQYMLYMDPGGNFYIYDIAHGTGTWGANTAGHPGAYATLQTDGNFVVYSASNVALWNSGTAGTGAERLDMEDDGRIIIYKSAWNSGTSTGKFNWTQLAHPPCDVGTGTGTTGVLGASQCFVSPNGHFALFLQTDGNLVLYDESTTPITALWMTNTPISPSDPGVALRTLYTYDGLGNLTCVEQHGGVTGTGCSSSPANDATSPWRVRRFTYDSVGRLLTAHNPESGTISYSYDNDGNLLQKTSPAPNQTGSATQTISYCYDELHRITGRAYGALSCPLASPVVSYTYDSGTNAKGKLVSMTDQAGTATYTYDIFGRLATETRSLIGANNALIPKTLSYEYNLDGSLYKLHYPSGAVVTYTPWNNGSIAVSTPQDAKDLGNGINYTTGAIYGPDLSLTSFVSGSGGAAAITNSFSYNKRLQPMTMSAATSSATVFSIGYDFHAGNGTAGSGTDNGNVFGITNYKDTSRNQAFTYDPLNRLLSAQNTGTNCAATTANGKTEYWGNSYSYDAWGNLLNKTVTKCSAENLSVTALVNNQLSGYAYDAAGNMTYDATANLNYNFDQENRITGAAGYTYTYDDDGNRVRKSNGNLAGNGTLYWYMTPGIVAESDLAGTLKSEYVFFDGERVARKDFSGSTTLVAYYFSDHLKTASIITDAAGNIKADSDYYPWGGELQFVNNDSNHFKFTGKERDSETGLDYFGARYYSNGLGRWVSADWSSTPIPVPYAVLGDPQSLNLYTYVRNLPSTNIDTDGHETLNSTNNERNGDTRMAPCSTQQCRDFDEKMSGAILDGFALVTGPVGRAYMAAEAVSDWRSGNKTSAVMGALSVIPGEKLIGSVWKLGNFARGITIETALGKNLAAGFPVIDKFLNGTATSIKSIDLTAKTYQNTEKLASTLENYVDKVSNFNGARYGKDIVEGSKITGRELQIAIPKGSMSAAQQKVFDTAAARAAQLKQPVKLTVTQIQ